MEKNDFFAASQELTIYSLGGYKNRRSWNYPAFLMICEAML